MNIKERLIYFAQSQNIPISKLERLSDLSNGYIKNTNGNPTVPKLEGVLRAFPNLSREWLINGTEPMLLPEPASSDAEQQEDDDITKIAKQHQEIGVNVQKLYYEISYLEVRLGELRKEEELYERRIANLRSAIDSIRRIIR